MISVAMATYNGEKYIEAQLDSILRQTIQVDEVIIQDDFSTDRTVSIINKFIKKNKLSNWKLEQNRKNIGYILTFKKAIEKCKGDIIILSDHDDLWMKDKVEIINNTFNRKENILVLATSFMEIDEQEKYISIKKRRGHSNNNLIRRRIKRKKLNKMTLEDVGAYNISPGCTCAFSFKIKNEIIRRNYKLPHDWQITLTGALLEGLYYLDIVTTKYRIHSNNTIGLGHKQSYEQRKKVCINDLRQKEEMKKIADNLNASDKQKKYINKIIRIFEIRKQLMQTKKIVKYGLRAIISCLGMNKLYETIGLDIISIIRTNRRRENI